LEISEDCVKVEILMGVIVAGGLILGSILVVVLLLVVSGFLSVPLLALISIGFACLALLGFCITAAVLSRRAGSHSR
jgi:hypothetical protein